ncbi:hypothetical protein K7X08_004420 [Anisodus acutangulus]|uniref:CG-1 domain-containing protein n=1 Tax=Anisodus acutangulus TaxID=402998 RepID=A0A9Q1MH93_9SOLA|nr:hypothetical protein K7X08_004420 [Anisodus acutangulus]
MIFFVPGGSIFLFDRKVLRYFRKDGHNWRKKKDGKTVKEAHEKLKGNKANISCIRSTESAQSKSLDESSSCDGFPGSQKLTTANADSASPTSPLTSAHEEVESVDYTSVPRRDGDGNCANGSFTSGFQSTMDLGSWQEVFEHCTRETPMQFHEQPVNQSLIADSSYDFGNNSLDENSLPSNLHNVRGPLYLSLDEQEAQLLQMNLQNLNSHLGSILEEEGLNKVDSFSHWAVKELEDVEELLVQPNNRISWSVIDNDGSCIPSELKLDSDTLNPSLSQVQLFSIIDFSPNCAYLASETKVLITGKFLKTEREVAEWKWSCLFGELEVVAEVLTDDLLRCHVPPHKPGIVPFYVSCSNRLACSEVREFEYLVGPSQEFDAADMLINEMHLLERFESSLSLSLANSHDSSEK